MNEKNRSDSSGSSSATSSPPTGALAPAASADTKRVGGRRSKRLLKAAAVAVALAVVAVAAVWLAWPEALGGNTGGADAATARVTRGDLVISVTEDGEVKAARQVVIRNELRWAAYIEELAPQGVIVPKGETIIKFKCDELEEALTSQEQRQAESSNALERAKANLAVTRKEVAYSLRKAEQGIQDAEEDFKRYMGEGALGLLEKLAAKELSEDDLGKHVGAGGEAMRKLTDAESDIQMAERDLTLAQGKLDFKLKANQELAPNSPYSDNEIKADRLSVDRLKLQVQRAETAKDMLLKYDIPKEARRLWAAVEAAGLAADRAKVEYTQGITQAEQDLAAKEFIYNSDVKKLQEYSEDRDLRVEIKAEENGLVVYDTGGNWRRPSDVIVEVGEKIQPRQQLMIIPDMSTLQLETRVYEAKIAQVKEKLNLDNRPARRQPSDADREARRARFERIRELPEGEREAALAKLREESGGRGAGRDGRSESTSRPAGEGRRRRDTRPAEEATTTPSEDRIEALIRLEALGGKVIHGYVHDISPMAEDKGWMSPGVKVHTAIVRFDKGQDISQLAPNMTAKVTLILERLEKVLKVPVAAVFSEGDTHYCWRVRDGRPEKVQVEIGKTNDREVQVLSGLSEGDEVLEAPPQGLAATEAQAEAAPQGEEQGRP